MMQISIFAATIFVYILLFILLQILIFRLWRIRELIRVFSLIAFGAGFVVWVSFYLLSRDYFPEDTIRGLLAFAGLYGSLGFSGTYIILGPISADRSLSAHICITMLRAGGTLTLNEVKTRYPQDVILNKRFEEYRSVGVMTEGADGKFQLTGKGRRIAFTFLTFLKALRMKENF